MHITQFFALEYIYYIINLPSAFSLIKFMPSASPASLSVSIYLASKQFIVFELSDVTFCLIQFFFNL